MNTYQLLEHKVWLKQKNFNRIKHKLNKTVKSLFNNKTLHQHQKNLIVNELKTSLEKAEKNLNEAKQKLLNHQLSNQQVLF